MLRTNSIYPMTKSGMVLCFVDPSTMVFGQKDAVTKALDARDGGAQSLLTNDAMMDAMRSVDSEPLWSILDGKGTQTMMKQLMGEAGAVTDFETVQHRLQASWYSMNFQHGVKFDLTISDRRHLYRSHRLFAAYRRRHAPQDERLRSREAGTQRHLHRFRFRPPLHPLRHHRRAIHQPSAVAALPEHGPLETLCNCCSRF